MVASRLEHKLPKVLIAPTLLNTEWRKFKTLPFLVSPFKISKKKITHHKWGLEDQKHPKFALIQGEPTAENVLSQRRKKPWSGRKKMTFSLKSSPWICGFSPTNLNIGETYLMTCQVSLVACHWWAIQDFDLSLVVASSLNKTRAATEPSFSAGSRRDPSKTQVISACKSKPEEGTWQVPGERWLIVLEMGMTSAWELNFKFKDRNWKFKSMSRTSESEHADL